jgi:hypothetical protein
MSTQTFPVGQAPRLILTECRGDLAIEVWDERTIEVQSDDGIRSTRQEGDALVIERAEGDLRLRVPTDTTVSAERVRGDATIQGLYAVALEAVDGDCAIADITGDARLRSIGGDAEAHRVGMLEIEEVGGDCAIKGIREALRYGTIGGDLSILGSDQTVVSGGSVGGDIAISDVASVEAGDVGGEATLKTIGGDLHLGSIGGDCTIRGGAGTLAIGHVGGDCAIVHSGAELRVGNVGGDLALTTAFSPESATRLTVGGDARIQLPKEPNLTIRATVGGDVRGQRMVSASGGLFTIVYGDGAARLDVIVGGDLDLRGGGEPRTSSSSGGWDQRGQFAEEMERLGEEMGRLGEELGRELSGAFGWGSRGAQRHREQERAHRERERAHREQERARHEGETAGRRDAEASKRVHVRINDREWRFDAERLEHLKQQAREAAKEGIAGALEAVERALAGIGVPPPPPPPPRPDAPFEAPPNAPSTGATIRIDKAAGQEGTPPEPDIAEEGAPGHGESVTASPSAETERAAILQMIAEGRISPEEGDMLLDALG